MEQAKYKFYLRKVDESQFPNIKKIVINESNSFYLKPSRGFNSRNVSRDGQGNEQVTKQSLDKKLNGNLKGIGLPVNVGSSNQLKQNLPLIRQHLTSFSKPHLSSNYLGRSIEKKAKNDEDALDYQIMKQKYEVYKSQLALVKSELNAMTTLVKEKEKEFDLLTDSLLREKEINLSNASHMQTQLDLINHQKERIHLLRKELNDAKGLISEMVAMRLKNMPIPALVSNESIKSIDYLLRIILYGKDMHLNCEINSIEACADWLTEWIDCKDRYMLMSYLTTISKEKDLIRKDFLEKQLNSLKEESVIISEDDIKEGEKEIIVNQCKVIDIEHKGWVDYNEYKSCLSGLLSRERFNRSIYELKQREPHPLFMLCYNVFNYKPEAPIEVSSIQSTAERITNDLFDIVIQKHQSDLIDKKPEPTTEDAFFITKTFVNQVLSSALNTYNSNQLIDWT